MSTLPPPAAAPLRIVVPAESRIEEGESVSLSVGRTPREGVPTGMSVVAGQYFRVTMSGMVTIGNPGGPTQYIFTASFCPRLADGKKVGPLGGMFYERTK